jgi:hypothetical protein
VNAAAWGIAAGLLATASEPASPLVAPDGSRVEWKAHPAPSPSLVVRPVDGSALLGRPEFGRDRILFRPALPFLSGKRYRAEWRDISGAPQGVEFELRSTKVAPPSVQLLPAAPLPANAVKLYLQFSQPMEQGVFLEKLRLIDAANTEITGPFRETELWSPDGKRLTVWLHPGRQKTGVKLQEDEGAVLRAGQRHWLWISGYWRATSGIALGADVRLPIEVIAADHTSPSVERRTVAAPASGTRDDLIITFDEPVDPMMLGTALTLSREEENVTIRITGSVDGRFWKATPHRPWAPGEYELRADPLLEDLAGNSLDRPFEIDLSDPGVLVKGSVRRRFLIR